MSSFPVSMLTGVPDPISNRRYLSSARTLDLFPGDVESWQKVKEASTRAVPTVKSNEALRTGARLSCAKFIILYYFFGVGAGVGDGVGWSSPPLKLLLASHPLIVTPMLNRAVQRFTGVRVPKFAGIC